MSFAFTAKQREALDNFLASAAMWVMLFGGGRSGKTFVAVYCIVMRALKAPGSRHLIARFRFKHVKSTVVLDTFPKVMRLCFPNVQYELNKTDWYVKLPGQAEIWFGGLDEKERMEKLLGFEFVTIYINEASQIAWAGVQLLLTRLAQRVMQIVEGREPRLMKLRFIFDCNPPRKSHWTFRVFKQKVDPETREPLPNPEQFVAIQMNPRDNEANISPEYLVAMGGLSKRMRRRFVDGEFADDTPNALFNEADIDKWRIIDGDLPSFVRVVVAVDPSGASDDEVNADNDEVGITVDALGTDGNAYLLEDITVKGGPATWGRVAVQAYMRHSADVIVGETNFGGGMVKSTIAVAAKDLEVRPTFKMVTASRGKIQRAEPFSALYEQGKVRHVGSFTKLEDELADFSTGGFMGPKSPNRADAHIWGLAELFPAMVRKAEAVKPDVPLPMASAWSKR